MNKAKLIVEREITENNVTSFIDVLIDLGDGLEEPISDLGYHTDNIENMTMTDDEIYENFIEGYYTFESTEEEEIEEEKMAKIEEFRDSGEDRKEVLQWFRVSGFLYSWLKKFNEVVLETEDSTYWGRTCCGQATFLDHVIQQIAQELPEGYFNQ
jgi:hypothetical protein